MKKALAVALAAVMLVPSTGLAATSPVKTDINGKKTAITAQYEGKDTVLTVVIDGKTLVEGKDFTVEGKQPTARGTYTLKIKGMGLYDGVAEIAYTIKKADKPVMTISAKAQKVLAKGFKAKQLKKKSKKVNLGIKTKGAKKTFSVKGKKAKKWISVNKKGVVTLKKGIKKGVYKIKVQIKGTKNFKKGTRTIKITVK